MNYVLSRALVERSKNKRYIIEKCDQRALQRMMKKEGLLM